MALTSERCFVSIFFWPTSWILLKQYGLWVNMVSESIAHSPFGLIDSEPIRARGIIVKYYCWYRVWLFSFLLGAEWDYSIELLTNGNLAHAQILKLTELNKLTVCWWMKLQTTELTRPFTVFSVDEPSLNNSFAFSIQGQSAFRLTVNATDQ